MRTITSLQYDCLGLVLIRVPLYMENHTTTVGSHCSAITTKPLRVLIKQLRKSPPTTTVMPHSTTVGSPHMYHIRKYGTGSQLSGPHVNKGFPF